MTDVGLQPSLPHLGLGSLLSLPEPCWPPRAEMTDKRNPPFFNETNLGVLHHKLPFRETMELFIETLTGTCFQLRVSPFEQVISVKAKIQRLEGMCPLLTQWCCSLTAVLILYNCEVPHSTCFTYCMHESVVLYCKQVLIFRGKLSQSDTPLKLLSKLSIRDPQIMNN